MRNRMGRLKPTSFKTVNGLKVYITPSGRNYVTKNRTRIYTYQKNNSGIGTVFTTGGLVSKRGYGEARVFNTKSGAYYAGNGKKLYKHKNGKYYNVM